MSNEKIANSESLRRHAQVAETQTAEATTRDAARTHARSAAQGAADMADKARREREGSADVAADLKRGANPQDARPRGDQPPSTK